MMLKKSIVERKLVTGAFLMEFSTPGIGHILNAANCDFALLDMEHSGFGIETIKATLKFLEAGGITTIVRPPSSLYRDISVVLDAGADGIMIPRVNDADEARRIVESVKYEPLGKRGAGFGIAHDRYTTGDLPTKMIKANESTIVVIQIETEEGLNNVEKIAAVDGVDALWIGHFDLSISLGIAGNFKHSKFQSSLQRISSAAKCNKKSLGYMAASVDDGVAYANLGFNLFCYSADSWLFRDALASGLKDLRNKILISHTRKDHMNLQ